MDDTVAKQINSWVRMTLLHKMYYTKWFAYLQIWKNFEGKNITSYATCTSELGIKIFATKGFSFRKIILYLL